MMMSAGDGCQWQNVKPNETEPPGTQLYHVGVLASNPLPGCTLKAVGQKPALPQALQVTADSDWSVLLCTWMA